MVSKELKLATNIYRCILMFTILLWQVPLNGQIDFTGSDVLIDFTGFNATGFAPTPAAGQLDSDTWSVTGLSDGDLAFGATGTSGDYARGGNFGGVTTGGIYSVILPSGDIALGVQPTTADFTSGSIVLKINNNTGGVLNDIDIEWDVYVFNDQNRSNNFFLQYSLDNVSYTTGTPAAGVGVASPEVADPSPSWVLTDRNAELTGLGIPIGSDFYVRWFSADVAGSGSRDEFGLDNISISVPCEIVCPAPISVSNDPGVCGAVVNYTTTVSGSCAGPAFCLPLPGSTFNIGTTVVLCSTLDLNGDIVSCAFPVNVTDDEAPSINCPADMTVASDPGSCGAIVNFTTSATDNCSATVICSPPSGSFFPVGTTTVNCTATDPAGNTATCAFDVTVDYNGPEFEAIATCEDFFGDPVDVGTYLVEVLLSVAPGGPIDITVGGETVSTVVSAGSYFFGPFSHSSGTVDLNDPLPSAVNGVLPVTVQLQGAGPECSENREVGETFCGPTAVVDCDCDNPSSTDILAAGQVLIQSQPGTFVAGGSSGNTQLYVLLDYTGGIYDWNYYGYFDNVPFGDYEGFAINIKNSDLGALLSLLALGDWSAIYDGGVVSNGLCYTVCGPIPVLVDCGCKLCWEDAIYTFPSIPPGGVWSGDVNAAGEFDQNAGVGTYVAVYTYTHPITGEVFVKEQTFMVDFCCFADAGDLCPVALPHATLDLCEGQEHGGYVQTYDYNGTEPGFGEYSYGFILVDDLGNIIQYVNGIGDFEFAILTAGEYFAYGISYGESINPLTIDDYFSNPLLTFDQIIDDIANGLCIDLTNTLPDGSVANVLIYPTPTVINNAPAMVVQNSGLTQFIGTPAEGDNPPDNGWWTGDSIDTDGLFNPEILGTYPITYHYFSFPGCGGSETVDVVVVPEGTTGNFDIGVSNSEICPGESVQLIITMPEYPLSGTIEVDGIYYVVPANSNEFIIEVTPPGTKVYILDHIEFTDGTYFQLNDEIEVVVDPVSPEVACKNKEIVLEDGEAYSLVPEDVTDYYTDNCAISSFELSQWDFDLSHVGMNSVAVTVMDSNGNTSGCLATVDVIYNDVILPTLTVNATATDQSCSSVDLESMEAYNAGLMDGYQAAAFEEGMINFFNMLGLTPTANDNAPGVVLNVVGISSNTIGITCPDLLEISISYQAEDAQGNLSTDVITSTLTIVDEESPMISGLESSVLVTDPQDIPAPSGNEIVSDCSDFTLFLEETISGNPDGDHEIERIYAAVDVCNNSSEFIQIITVDVDELPTLVAGLNNANQECTDVNIDDVLAYENGTMSPTDQATFQQEMEDLFDQLNLVPQAFDDNPDVGVVVSSFEVTLGECPNIASIAITYQAKDSSGNLSVNTETSVLSITDTQAPTITGVVEYIEVGSQAEIPQAFGSDIVSDCGPFNFGVSESIIGSTDCDFTLERIYSAIDICGNQSSVTQIILVGYDTAPPQISAPAQLNFEFNGTTGVCLSPLTIELPLAIDNCELDPNSWTHNSIYADSNNISPADISGNYPIGTTEVTWTVSDMFGNVTSHTMMIKVAKIAPAANLFADCDENPNKVAFTWDEVQGTAGYRIIVKNVPGTGTPALNLQATQLNPNFTYKTWHNSNFVPGGQYRFRIYSGCLSEPGLNPNQISNYTVSASDWYYFTNPCLAPILSDDTPATSDFRIEETTQMSLAIYPNPTDGFTSLEIIAMQSEEGIVTVRDMLGRTVIQRNTNLVNGYNLLDIDMGAYANGTYMIEVITTNERVVARLSKSN